MPRVPPHLPESYGLGELASAGVLRSACASPHHNRALTLQKAWSLISGAGVAGTALEYMAFGTIPRVASGDRFGVGTLRSAAAR